MGETASCHQWMVVYTSSLHAVSLLGLVLGLVLVLPSLVLHLSLRQPLEKVGRQGKQELLPHTLCHLLLHQYPYLPHL